MKLQEIMSQAQVFASAWSLVGGRFDGGNAMDEAEVAKNELHQMVAEALAQPQQEPIAVELVGVEEAIKEGNGFWKSCTGCYETNEGHPPTGAFFSSVFKCYMGHGCSECGGIGAIWDDTDYEAMADHMMRDDAAPQPAQRKPLTDDEIGKAFDNREIGLSVFGCFLAGVHFAEAAHNIKENT